MRTVCVLGLCLLVVACTQARFVDEEEIYDPDLVSDLDLYEPYSDTYGLGLKGHCHCCKHGCWCHAMEMGLAVSITMQVDETDSSAVAQVVAFITVGKAHFDKKFAVNKIEDFCETVDGKEFCFDFDIKYRPSERNRKMRGCVKLTKPKEIDLGCFWLPLMEDGNDVFGYPYDDSKSVSEDEEMIFM